MSRLKILFFVYGCLLGVCLPIRTNTTRRARLSERRTRFLLSEERKASREYHSAGLHRMGADEARHARRHERALKRF